MRMGHGIQGGAASVQLSSLVEWRGLPLHSTSDDNWTLAAPFDE